MNKPLMIVPLLALSTLGWIQSRARPEVALGQSQMILEWAPGREAVVRVVAESDEQLERVQVFRPDGRELVDLDTHSGLNRGLSGMEIELRESDLRTLLGTYANGSYDIRATTARGNLALGSAKLSFDLPAAPRILLPKPGTLVEDSNLTVAWSGDRAAAGYEVELEQNDDDGLRVKLPPERSSFRVPDGFLRPGTETSLEIATIGKNGNRTVSEVRFFTRP